MKFLSLNTKLIFSRTENQKKKEARDARVSKSKKQALAKAKSTREAN